jgi:anti-sigma B factor antagonist
MKYSIDKQPNFSVLTLNEENLNSLIAPELKSDLIIFKNEGIKHIIIDLQQVKYVDSSGLSAILTGNRMWKEDGAFILTGITSPMVNKLIEISKLDTVLTIFPSMEQAVDYLSLEVEAESENDEI